MKKSFWLVGLATTVLLAGYAFTFGYMASQSVVYVVYLTLIGFAIAMACHHSAPTHLENAALWLVILVFLSSYCVKLFLIVVSPESPVILGMVPRMSLGDYDRSLLAIEALSLTSIGIVTFAATLNLMPRRPAPVVLAQLPDADVPDGKHIVLMLVVGVLLSVMSVWLSHRYDIGLMGAGNQTVLPFRLRGIVFYLQNYSLPGLLLLTSYFAYRRGLRVLLFAAVGLLILNGVADLLIRSSKSALLAPILYLAFLLVASGIAIRMIHVILAAAASIPILVVLPFFHVFRTYRLAGQGVWESIGSIALSKEFHLIDLLTSGITWIIYRLPGVDILMAILGHRASPVGERWLEVLQSPNGIAGYLTNDVFLTPSSHFHLNAPGYFGWWYLLLGISGIVVGGAVLALFVRFVWPLALGCALYVSVIIRVFLLMLLFVAFSEGTVDSMLKMVMVMAVTVAILELTVRALRAWKVVGESN